MPHQPASAEHRAEYQGRTVYFCCEECVGKFHQNPAAYLAVLNASTANNPPASTTPPAADTPKPGAFLGLAIAVVEFVERHLGLGAYLVVVVIGVGLARRRGGRFARLGRLDTLAVLVLAGVCVEMGREAGRARSEAAAAREVARQAASAPGLGRPIPSGQLLTWSWPQGFHELPKGLKNTYYRGNDERSPQLFNGGNYRTATFTVSIRTADGREVRAGDNLAGVSLRLHISIVRAPKTSPHFFKRDQMARVFLFSAAEGTAPAPVPLTVVRPDQEWSVELPVGEPVPANGYVKQAGVWCLSMRPGPTPDPVSGVVHYYIQCTLHFQDGVIAAESAVWMVPVMMSPILNGPRADGEWFSDRPIPEITGENTTDPDLLGIPKAERK
jgi:YHS domain-containing protein